MASILVFAGSLRKDSFNKKVVSLAYHILSNLGHKVLEIQLNNFPLPIYDNDIEVKEGIPENAHKFRELLKSHDGFLISSPEYNSALTAVLKNTFDWTSRASGADPMCVGYQDKIIALCSASPSSFGGIRGLTAARLILSSMGSVVLPKMFILPYADKAFEANGQLNNQAQKDQLERVCNELSKYF